MKKLLAILILLTSYDPGFCQITTITGVVRDLKNNELVPYVNIGIANKSTGTVSDINGQFKLELNETITIKDTVLFSYVGYETTKLPISEFLNQKRTIYLEPKAVELKEVLISSKIIKRTPRIIGKSSKGLGFTHFNFYTYNEKDVDDRLSKEVGMKFQIGRNCQIKDLNFNISGNDFKHLKFRVHFYRVENGYPTELIVEKNIVFEVNNNFTGWYQLNLEPFDIYLDEKDKQVAVTIQWLESVKSNEKSKYFSISTAGSPINTAYFREKTMDSWNKSGQALCFYLNALCE
jgi:hypothetical protein